VSDEGKTIQEIRAQHSAQRAEMQTARYARTDEIKAETGVEPGPCLDYMNDQQLSELLRDQMQQKIEHERALKVAEAETLFEDYRREHDERAAWVDAGLYHVEGNGEAMLRCADATDEQLAGYLDWAIQQDNDDIARLVFAEAQRRGLSGMQHRATKAGKPKVCSTNERSES
jgi:hypothetical protein